MVALSQITELHIELSSYCEARASHDFEMHMQSLMMSGARDRATALRWVHEAEGTDGDDEYLCFTLGLPYRYFVQKELA